MLPVYSSSGAPNWVSALQVRHDSASKSRKKRQPVKASKTQNAQTKTHKQEHKRLWGTRWAWTKSTRLLFSRLEKETVLRLRLSSGWFCGRSKMPLICLSLSLPLQTDSPQLWPPRRRGEERQKTELRQSWSAVTLKILIVLHPSSRAFSSRPSLDAGQKWREIKYEPQQAGHQTQREPVDLTWPCSSHVPATLFQSSALKKPDRTGQWWNVSHFRTNISFTQPKQGPPPQKKQPLSKFVSFYFYSQVCIYPRADAPNRRVTQAHTLLSSQTF